MLSRVRQTTIILLGLLAFLGGVVFARTKLPLGFYWVVLCLASVLLTARKSKLIALIGIVVLGFVAGWWRGAQYVRSLQAYEQSYKQPALIEVTALEDAAYGDKTQLAFAAGNIIMLRPVPQKLVGQISVQGFGVSMVYRGDRVQLSGKIYPTLGGKRGKMSYAKITLLAHHSTLIDSFRRRFSAAMYSVLPEPQASFALGLLIGQKNTLPATTSSQLSAVGLTHIIAVSGYNLTIIIEAVKRWRAKKSRYQTLILAFVLMLMFVLCAGLSASILRATLVSTLSLLAWYYGRQFRPLVLLTLAASLTVAYYPPYIWDDVGWYLSFLAFFGVLVVGPIVTAQVYRRAKPKLLVAIVIETIAAQIMTIPLILFVFNRLSVLGLFANSLVVPFVPLAMLLSVAAGLCGMLAPLVGGLVALPARLLLSYMLSVAGFFSSIPHSLIEHSISFADTLYLYGLILLITARLGLKNRDKHGIITDENFEEIGI